MASAQVPFIMAHPAKGITRKIGPRDSGAGPPLQSRIDRSLPAINHRQLDRNRQPLELGTGFVEHGSEAVTRQRPDVEIRRTHARITIFSALRPAVYR